MWRQFDPVRPADNLLWLEDGPSRDQASVQRHLDGTIQIGPITERLDQRGDELR
jgi:hypothetical protein